MVCKLKKLGSQVLELMKTNQLCELHVIWIHNTLWSGDSSSVKRWFMDHRLWVWIPPTAEIIFVCARALGSLSQFGKISTGPQWRGSSTWSSNLRYEVMSFADWMWSVIASTLELKKIPDVLDTNNTRTSHVGHAARSRKKSQWSDYLSHNTPSSRSIRSGIITHTLTWFADLSKHEQPPENTHPISYKNINLCMQKKQATNFWVVARFEV